MGDPAGIGLDITLAAWSACRKKGPVFAFLGDPAALHDRAARLGVTVPISEISDLAEATSRFSASLPVLPFLLAEKAVPGTPSQANASAILTSIRQAVALTQQGRAAAVVTNPISKAVLQEAGFSHPGHTEYLADLAARPGTEPPFPVMMLASAGLRVVPVTIHIPLAQVPRKLTHALLRRTAVTTHEGLSRRFGIARPRIGVTGLNPHAGESGHMGREEIDIIAPVISSLKSAGMEIAGPYPADAIFQERQRGAFDAIVAMYHDQALVPIKALAFDTAVNVTLGLPFVRTSPDHGTAFDIAGTGKASASSLICALEMAASMADHREHAA